MKEGIKDLMEKRLQRLKEENDSLRQKLSSVRAENKSLLKKSNNFNNLFSANPSGIILVQQGKVECVNSRIERQLGYSSDVITGIDFLRLVHPKQRPAISGLIKKWLSGKFPHESCEIDIVTQGGEILHYDARVNKAIYNGRNALILNMVDSERGTDKARKKLIEEKLKTGLLMASCISREFRECFKTFLMGAEKIRGDSAKTGFLIPDENELNKAHEILKKLDLMTGNASEKDNRTLFDLNEIASKAVLSSMNEWKDKAESKELNVGIKTYLRASCLIQGDPFELQEAISIMIHNAVNAMPDGGDVLLTTEDNGGYGYIYVQDSGEGIPDELMGSIFDPFFTTRGKSSLGLGLSIAYSIIKRYNGEINVSSIANNGSVFEVRLPVADRKLIGPGNQPKKKIKDSRILMVQGEDIVNQLLIQMLTDKGCALDHVFNVPETVRLLKKRKFDLVIADTELPIPDEKAFVKELKKIDQDILVVLIAGHVQEERTDGQDKTRADLRMPKPLDLNKAMQMLSDLLMGRLDG
jgi:PAS domain S-box-containing protein